MPIPLDEDKASYFSELQPTSRGLGAVVSQVMALLTIPRAKQDQRSRRGRRECSRRLTDSGLPFTISWLASLRLSGPEIAKLPVSLKKSYAVENVIVSYR